MKALGLIALLTLAACGARDRAKPTEVEIEWPDAGQPGVRTVAPSAEPSAADAGALPPAETSTEDTETSPEAAR